MKKTNLFLAVAVMAPLMAMAQGTQRAQPEAVRPLPAPNIGTPESGIRPPGPAQQFVPGAPMPTPMPAGSVAATRAPADLKQEAIEQTAPLTVREILELRRELQDRADAINQPLGPIGKPVRRLITMDLSPSAAPEVVRSSFGQGTVVTFLDAVGRPWPILAAENFNPRGLDVAVLGTNGVSIGVKSPATRIGNIAVQLEGFASPVTFTVAIGQQEIDYSVEMQLPRYLPGAPAPVGSVEALPSLNAPQLLDYLLGTVPVGVRALASNAGNVKAWQLNATTMVVRTEGMLASPRYNRRQSSANGVNVYELPISPSLILAAQGQMQTVSLSGFEGTKEQKQ